MTPFPIPVTQVLSNVAAFFVFLTIGFGFGYVLESAGFGNSEKLAGQFYFKDLTVLKVMFGAIIVAMVLIFGASAVGLLDYNLIWVNPTYLWPGIVGGLIMGFGFIIGGFCPGTSIVAAATLKIDGMFFVLGALFGIFLFGETVGYFDIFWTSSYFGRITIQDWLNVDAGWVVLGVVFMALFMFLGGEQLERLFGGMDPKQAPKLRFVGAGILVIVALAVLFIGQPTTEDRWARLADEKQVLLDERSVYVQPAELLHTMHDHKINLVMLDVRDEADYNLFHIADARRVDLESLDELIPELHLEPANTVFMVMSNDENRATDAWKILVAESVPNAYVLEGGVNGWLTAFAENESGIAPLEIAATDEIAFIFAAALGAAYDSADPDPHGFEFEYEPKIKLEMKRAPTGGGCG